MQAGSGDGGVEAGGGGGASEGPSGSSTPPLPRAPEMEDTVCAPYLPATGSDKVGSEGGEMDAYGENGEPRDRCGTFGCTLPDKHPGLHCIPELGKRVRRPPPAPRRRRRR